MGDLKITADGSESMILKDNTAMVAGSNTLLTGGDHAYATAGFMENAVLGLLLSTLLGGKLEVTVGNTVLDGTLTKLSGQEIEIGAVKQHLAVTTPTVNTLFLTRATAMKERVIGANTEVKAITTSLAASKTRLRNTSSAAVAQRITQVATVAQNIATSVSTLANALRWVTSDFEMSEVRTRMNTVSTKLATLIQMT
jgi:hypothetical protein